MMYQKTDRCGQVLTWQTKIMSVSLMVSAWPTATATIPEIICTVRE